MFTLKGHSPLPLISPVLTAEMVGVSNCSRNLRRRKQRTAGQKHPFPPPQIIYGMLESREKGVGCRGQERRVAASSGQRRYCEPEPRTGRRWVSHRSLAPYVVFAAHAPVSEQCVIQKNSSPGWQRLSCLPDSRMRCNRAFKCSLQDVRLSICTCVGTPRQG